MRVGLLYQHLGRNGDLRSVVEQIGTADHLGFDTLWIEERHSDASSLGSLPILLAALATRTRTMRLGGFKVMALGHPARTAEDFAMIDLLSGGRLNFGAAVGNRAEDFRVFQVPFAERAGRFREALDIVLHAWTSDEFRYGGRYYQFPAHTAAESSVARQRHMASPFVPQWERGPEVPDYLTVTPKPLQQPRPPVWILAEDGDLLTYAAAHGHSVVLPYGQLRDLEAAAVAYDAALAKAHRDRHEVELAIITDLRFDGERLASDTLAHLHRLQAATGLNHLVWRVPYPDLPHERIRAALKQFAGEVQPLLQA